MKPHSIWFPLSPPPSSAPFSASPTCPVLSLGEGWGEKLFQATLRSVCHSRPFRFPLQHCATHVYGLVCLPPGLSLSAGSRPLLSVCHHSTEYVLSFCCPDRGWSNKAPDQVSFHYFNEKKKKILEILDWFLFLLWLLGSSEYNIKIMEYINSSPDPAGSSLTLGPLTPSSQVKRGVQAGALPCSVSPSLSVSQQTLDHPSGFLVALHSCPQTRQEQS